uniref:Uncharacterized protein n=1 Tax=Cucumis melo TaxID=3656 RepID=A0A9I9EHN8_CUCME
CKVASGWALWCLRCNRHKGCGATLSDTTLLSDVFSEICVVLKRCHIWAALSDIFGIDSNPFSRRGKELCSSLEIKICRCCHRRCLLYMRYDRCFLLIEFPFLQLLLLISNQEFFTLPFIHFWKWVSSIPSLIGSGVGISLLNEEIVGE